MSRELPFHCSHFTVHLFCMVIVLIGTLANSLSLSAQDSVRMRRDIKVLASPEMWGRSGCHDGEAKAAAYLQKEMQLIGAKPLGDNGFQKFDIPAYKMEGRVSMSVDGQNLSPFEDYRIEPYSRSIHQQNIPIIRFDASLLLKKNEKKLRRFLVKNAEALPKSILYVGAVNAKNLKPEEVDELNAQLRTLKQHNPYKAMGLLFGVEELPVWGLSSTRVEHDFACIYILMYKIAKDTKSVSLDFENVFFTKHTQNVCFMIEGTEHPDEYIVMGAHYDHLGCMGDEVIFTGAHDNASGTAAVLNFARYFAKNPPKYTTVFLFFTCEETGLVGSKYFVEHPLLDLSKVKLMMNLDMFCGGDEGIMVVNSQSEQMRPFYDNMVKINDENNYISAVKSRANAANSDHYFFSQHCPAMFIYTMGGRYGGYHNYTDTCERCGLNCFEGLFSLIRDFISDIK